jgi:hypothetical protein
MARGRPHRSGAGNLTAFLIHGHDRRKIARLRMRPATIAFLQKNNPP